MADNTYNIYNTDGTKTYIVDENTTNKETSVTLIGHGMPDYGEDQNTNFIHLLENFSSNDEPVNPVIGQLWYKKNNEGNELYICVATNFVSDTADSTVNDAIENGLITPKPPKKWVKIPFITFDDKAKHKSGDLKYDELEHALYVYDDTKDYKKWNKIGPDVKTYAYQEMLQSTVEPNGPCVRLKREDFCIDTDIFNTGTSTGTLAMVKMTVLAKECGNSELTTRSCGWIYTFMVRSIKRSSGYSLSIIGNPSYELIARTNNTDWYINIEKPEEDSGDIRVELRDYDGDVSKMNFSCYCEITRI